MVNFLEALYVVTALSVVGSVIALVRRKPRTAWRFGMVAGICALTAIALYWLLAPPV